MCCNVHCLQCFCFSFRKDKRFSFSLKVLNNKLENELLKQHKQKLYDMHLNMYIFQMTLAGNNVIWFNTLEQPLNET